MDGLEAVSAARLRHEIPDSPGTVEFRQMAEAGELRAWRSGGGLLLMEAAGQLAGARGEVEAADVQRLYAEHALDCELVADEAAYERLKDAFALERAVVYTLDGAWRAPSLTIAGLVIRTLDARESLAHVSEELREELAYALPRTRVLAGCMDGLPVSFAYVCASSRYADMSIDTIEAYRRRGIATVVAAAMVDAVVAAGKTPVWGALDSNRASLAIAAHLGFNRPAATLYVAEASAG